MKALLRWIAKIAGSALTIILVIIFLPYATNLASKFLPDESGAAIKASAILSTKLENSARLETLCVTEEGVLNYDIQAALIGSVASVNASYVYEASFGIDLKEVEIQLHENGMTFILPPVALLQDSLTLQTVYRDDFWYPGFSDTDYANLLEAERIARRESYLNGENQQMLWEATVTAFEQTICNWLGSVSDNLVFDYQLWEDAIQ